MDMPLTSFRDAILDRCLEYLWDSWAPLGVAGYGEGDGGTVADPEALIAFSCTMARYDARLFDEMADWLARNHRHASPQRLRAMFDGVGFGGGRVMSGMARALARVSPSPKWKPLVNVAEPLTEAESLFLLKDGSPLPGVSRLDVDFLAMGLRRGPLVLRRHAREFAWRQPSCLMLRLRALFGVGARADVLAYLICRGEGHSHAIARQLRYSQKTVYDVLADFESAGIVVSSRSGRERSYRLIHSGFSESLVGGMVAPRWCEWPSVFVAVERFWRGIDRSVRLKIGDSLQLSEMFLLTRELVRSINGIEGMPGQPEPPANGGWDTYAELGLSVVEDALQDSKAVAT